MPVRLTKTKKSKESFTTGAQAGDLLNFLYNTLGGLDLKNVPTSVPFAYTKSTTSLSGKTQTVTLSDIVLPVNTPTQIITIGSYNVKVNCSDASNNTTSQTLVININ